MALQTHGDSVGKVVYDEDEVLTFATHERSGWDGCNGNDRMKDFSSSFPIRVFPFHPVESVPNAVGAQT